MMIETTQSWDVIEYYFESKCISRVNSSMVPALESFISIEKVAYRIKRITYAVDKPLQSYPCMRANIDIEKA